MDSKNMKNLLSALWAPFTNTIAPSRLCAWFAAIVYSAGATIHIGGKDNIMQFGMFSPQDGKIWWVGEGKDNRLLFEKVLCRNGIAENLLSIIIMCAWFSSIVWSALPFRLMRKTMLRCWDVSPQNQQFDECAWFTGII